MSVQLKVSSATFRKEMTKKSKEYIRKYIDEMHYIASVEIGELKPKIPVDTGTLRRSYSTSKNYQKKTVRFGSNPDGGFKDVEYANWIETGERRLGGGSSRIITRNGTKGKWAFKEAKKNILKKIKNIKL